MVRLTSEVVWFLWLFPYFNSMLPKTKRDRIKQIWEWSGSNLARQYSP